MIKIAFVINYITNSGPGRVVLGIIHNLDFKLYTVSLITLFSGNDTEIVTDLKAKNVTVYECKTLNRLRCILGQDAEFQELLQKEQFDIIHTHGFIPDLLVSRIKVHTKTISTLHNNMFEDYVNHYGVISSWLLTTIHIRALRQIDRKICCSRSVYDVMKQKTNNVYYIRNGITCSKTKHQITRELLGIPDNAKVYIFVGCLIPRKNVPFLIGEFVNNHLNNEYLIILGNGIEQTECQSLADKHVKMCGFQSDPISYYTISDIYISSSKSEGFSISVLEALSCGLGIFLSDIPSHREVLEIQNNINLGQLFRKDNFVKQWDVVRTTAFNKRDIQSFAMAELSAARMAREYEAEYRKLMTDV